MFDIFKKFKKEESSKDLAKERLKLVLIHDKANVSPEFLEIVKDEIIKVIKKYMEIDESSLDIQLTKKQSDAGNRIVPALVANIPILNVKSSAELEIKKSKEPSNEENVLEESKTEPKDEAQPKTTKKVQSAKASDTKKTAKK